MRLSHANGNSYIVVDGEETPAIIANPCGARYNTVGERLNIASHSKFFVTQLFAPISQSSQLDVSVDASLEHVTLPQGHITIKLEGPKETVNPSMAYKYYVSLKAKPGQSLSRLEGFRYCKAEKKPVKILDVPFSADSNKPVNLGIGIKNRVLIIKADGKTLCEYKDKYLFRPDKIFLSAYAARGSFDNLKVVADGKMVINDTFDLETKKALAAKWDRPLDFTPKSKDAFAVAGVHLYTTNAIDLASAWIGPDKFDFSGFDNELRGVLQQDPKAKLLVRMWICPPDWWLNKNPDEVAKCIERRTGKSKKSKWGLASFASEKWRKESSQAIEKFIEHLDQIPEGKRVVGMNVAGGRSKEWTYAWVPDFYDYSKANEIAFRQWLKHKYQTDVKLQKAWKQPNVTFIEAKLPSPEKRKAGNMGDFIDPLLGRQVIDYKRFHSDMVAECLIEFAKTVKKKSRGRLFTVAFYGYHFSSNPNLGHDSMHKVLDSEYIDALACPPDYRDRAAGGVTSNHLPVKSVFLNNKMWFLEDDTRTFLSWATKHGRTYTPAETAGVMKRNFAYTFSYSGGIWYLDWHRGWMNHPSIVGSVRHFMKISKTVPPAKRTRNTQICVVISETSKDYMRSELGFRGNIYRTQYHQAISRIGAPYDVIYINDLSKAPDYKMYIFLDTFYLTSQQRELIDRKCKRGGNTIIWIHAVGYITEDGFSVQAMSDLIGMRIRTVNKISKQKLTIFPQGHKTIEASHEFGPVLIAVDSSAEKLGTLNTSDGIRGCGFAEKQFNDWKSVWVAVPVLPSSVLRDYAKKAGVNIYSDKNDWVAATDFMLAVHASNDGVRVIQLPSKVDVFNPFTAKNIAKQTSTIKIDMKKGETFFGLLDYN